MTKEQILAKLQKDADAAAVKADVTAKAFAATDAHGAVSYDPVAFAKAFAAANDKVAADTAIAEIKEADDD